MAVKLSLFAKLAVALVLVALLVFGLIVWMRPTALVVPVVRDKAINAVPGSVIVEAEFTMEIKSELGGRIVHSELEPGKRFAEGALLVRIDTRDVDLEIERIESDYEAAKRRIAVGSAIELELATAREQLENFERLHRIGQLAETELIQRRRGVVALEQKLELEKVDNASRLENFENSLRVKRRQREKMTVHAPFDGVVSQVYARPGDLIGGGAPIARLIATSRTVEARISEENFAGIREGQKASVRFLGYGGQLYGANVAKILPTADQETQRYIVYLNVDLDPVALVPGITGEVSIVVGERDNTLVIPRRALYGNNVFVVARNLVEIRQVTVGFTALNFVEILEGLEEGDLVIVDRLDSFRSGDRVRTRFEQTN
jgi:RND family efflux transporter MFP subunit